MKSGSARVEWSRECSRSWGQKTEDAQGLMEPWWPWGSFAFTLRDLMYTVWQGSKLSLPEKGWNDKKVPGSQWTHWERFFAGIAKKRGEKMASGKKKKMVTQRASEFVLFSLHKGSEHWMWGIKISEYPTRLSIPCDHWRKGGGHFPPPGSWRVGWQTCTSHKIC